MGDTKNKCCWLGCENDAAFHISAANRNDPDNYTHACEQHVGSLLGWADGFAPCNEWRVFYIGTPQVDAEQAKEMGA